MELAIIGLGKMGGNMMRRLIKGGHKVVAFSRSVESVKSAEKDGAIPAYSLDEIKTKLRAPRIIWVMVPSGDATETTLKSLSSLMSPKDIIIDGGNSNYKDTMTRAGWLKEKRFQFVDVGTSGGIWGLREGYSMMIGGSKESVDYLRPIFETLAPSPTEGWGHVGPNGAGHFVKMIHNGIEYGMMQAYAEGFEILEKKKEFNVDLFKVGQIWQKGSVVRSWLLDLTVAALEKDQKLQNIKPWVADSGEGRWTVKEAIDLDVPAPVITHSLMMRFISRDEENFAARLLSALRNQFGGHEIKK